MFATLLVGDEHFIAGVDVALGAGFAIDPNGRIFRQFVGRVLDSSFQDDFFLFADDFVDGSCRFLGASQRAN